MYFFGSLFVCLFLYPSSHPSVHPSMHVISGQVMLGRLISFMFTYVNRCRFIHLPYKYMHEYYVCTCLYVCIFKQYIYMCVFIDIGFSYITYVHVYLDWNINPFVCMIAIQILQWLKVFILYIYIDAHFHKNWNRVVCIYIYIIDVKLHRSQRKWIKSNFQKLG
jgi:hypothetical protein